MKYDYILVPIILALSIGIIIAWLWAISTYPKLGGTAYSLESEDNTKIELPKGKPHHKVLKEGTQ